MELDAELAFPYADDDLQFEEDIEADDDLILIDEDEAMIDDEVERLAEREFSIRRSYFERFEGDESLLKRYFSEYCNHRAEQQLLDAPYLGSLLRDDAAPPPVHAPSTSTVDASVLYEEEVDGSTVVAVMHSAATRRLQHPDHGERPAVGVVFDMDPEWTVASLQSHVASTHGPPVVCGSESLFIGVINGKPCGSGLAIFDSFNSALRDRDPLEAALQFVPLVKNGRILDPANLVLLRPFCIEERREKSSSTAPVPHQQQKRKVKTTALLETALHSVERLSQAIASAGGLDHVQFVAVDAEAAIVTPGCCPLPLEVAFVDCGCVSELIDPSHPQRTAPLEDLHGTLGPSLNWHDFLFPGVIEDPSDVRTAMMLSLRFAPGGHSIPFRGELTFQRRDYAMVASEVHALLHASSPRRVILINKGSIMDVQAIRWLYAAAKATTAAGVADEHVTVVDTPGPLDITMFDVKTLYRYLKYGSMGSDVANAVATTASTTTTGGDESGEAPVAAAVNRADCDAAFLKDLFATARRHCGRCWYHSEMLDLMDEDPDDASHCAKFDARSLAIVVAELLRQLRP